MTSKERVLSALNHQEPDRIPVCEYFWPEFEEKWRKTKGFSSDEDIYHYYKIDLRELSCKRWPRINDHLTIKKTSQQYEIFKDGWGTIVKQLPHSSTPEYLEFPIKKKSDIDNYNFESLEDPIRYSHFLAMVENNKKTALFGHVTGPYGLLWHTRGPEQSFYDIAEDPNFVRELVEKLTNGMIEIGIQQLERSKELLGIWIADDIAYNKGLMFSPDTYYKLFFPFLKKMCESFKKKGAKVVYHSDGDIRQAIDILIDAGIDAINPLEVRTGMDVMELKEKYGDKLSFIGNIDNTGTLRIGTKAEIKKEVNRKMKAAKGGGYIIGSSHSIGSDIPVENYEYFLQIVQEAKND